MSGLNLEGLEEVLPGQEIPRPAGELSGSAAGEIFDKHVEGLIRNLNPGRTYRHFELLNDVLSQHPECRTEEERNKLLGPPALQALLKRGQETMRKWCPERPFTEKQNDTADVVVMPTESLDLNLPTVHLIDVKSTSRDRNGQPPNIISAFKVARMCAHMLDSMNFNSHDLVYFGVTWRDQGDVITAEDFRIVELFKVQPDDLYINWSAALQIQFHIGSVNQSFDDTVEEWCRAFLKHFVEKARDRLDASEEKFITSFEPYLTH